MPNDGKALQSDNERAVRDGMDGSRRSARKGRTGRQVREPPVGAKGPYGAAVPGDAGRRERAVRGGRYGSRRLARKGRTGRHGREPPLGAKGPYGAAWAGDALIPAVGTDERILVSLSLPARGKGLAKRRDKELSAQGLGLALGSSFIAHC
jgi:hypothetical protein